MLVSIIIPAHNAANTIKRCLNSVQQQTYKDLEIICVDDGSTDNTAKLIAAAQKKDSRIRPIYNDVNSGVSISRNMGVEKATGKYITFVDADDYLARNTIKRLVDAIIDKGEPDFIRYNFISTNRTRNSEMGTLKDMDIIIPQARKIIMDAFFLGEKRIPTYTPLLIIKSKIAKEISFNKEIHYLEDTIYYLDLFAKAEKCSFVDEKLYNYTDNRNSVTRSIEAIPSRIRGMLLACNMIEKHQFLDELEKSILAQHILDLMITWIIILEVKNKKLFKKTFSDKKILDEIEQNIKKYHLDRINFVKKKYIKTVNKEHRVIAYLLMPILRIKYRSY